MKFLPVFLAFMLAAVCAQAADDKTTWQGFYLGVNAGGGWGEDHNTQYSPSGAATGISPTFDTRGGVVGGQAGYNYVTGPYLIGFDADFDSSNVEGGYRVASTRNGVEEKYQWLGSARLRLGMPLGNFLPYVTGGVAVSDIKDTYIRANTLYENNSQTRAGWTLGAGLEYALPQNLSVRADYRYDNFGSYTNASDSATPGFRYKQEPDVNIVTVGVSYYFK